MDYVIMVGKKVIDEIETVFISELGVGSSFILEQNLREMGLTRQTFKRSDINVFIAKLVKEYDKILGEHVKIIEKEIRKKFNQYKNH